jgi:hypothetical protein
MAAELRQLVQKENAVVRQRHSAGHRPLPTADQPRIRDSVMGGPKGVGRDDRSAGAGEAGDTMDAGGLEGFGQGHWWQDGGEMTR